MKPHDSSLNFLGAMVLVFCCVGCGSTDSSGSTSHGDPALVGTWTGTEVDFPPYSWTFVLTATTMDVQSTSGEGYKGNYTTDTSVDPKHIAGTITECPLASYIGKSWQGIYKIEGMTATIASNIPGDTTFPTTFTPGSTHQTRVFTLTKQ
jgi:uncharacterized protein (TIGR03067 family)